MQTFDQKAMCLPGPMRIVTSHEEFADLMKQGWGLVFSYQAEEVQMVLRFVPDEARSYPQGSRATVYGNDPWGRTSQEVPVPAGMRPAYDQAVVKKQFFVLRQDVEPALAAAAERARELSEEADVLSADLREQRELAEASRKLTEALTEERGKLRSDLACAENHIEQLAAKTRKYETVLGTLRTELGERRMREILGE